MRSGFSRRDVLKASAAVAAGVFATPVRAAAPEPTPVTPALVEAARKEGRVVWYAAMDLPVAERMARGFEAKYSGVAVRIERTGSERQFQRLAQEYAANVFAADVIHASDASHFVAWKRNGWLAPFVPEEVARYFAPEHRDPDGGFATARVSVVSLGYNTDLVKPQDAPRGFVDLLHPRWQNRIVKAHPSYSGTIMTSTFQIARELGWDYFEKLARQKVLQVQSAVDPPNKLALGERQVMADGNDFNLIQHKEAGKPVEVVYPVEGAPLIVCPNGVLKGAPNPNAARLLQSYILSREGQQLLCDFAAQHSAHPEVTEKPGRRPLAQIKVMRDDPAAVEAQAEEIKAHYARIFGV
ncbi:MAG TPA: extracellular solute-binding protein [Xanthobacteraceae bacterium]|jgi:iron(III) transport system substrate-binding protein